jgi:hypothetical protein
LAQGARTLAIVIRENVWKNRETSPAVALGTGFAL